ncbi:MAG: tRNA lysidine(34) synthetase TilS [Pseudomonadota bacterium]
MAADVVCERVARVLADAAAVPGTTRFVLAVSGGLDSMVLLDAVAAGRDAFPHAQLDCAYVNHELHPDAARWGALVARAAGARGLRFLDLASGPIDPAGTGLEAAARKARYRALAKVMAAGDVLLTAHHRDDQAETVLLQLLRGAGVAGLRAMPQATAFGAGRHVRPLLALPRETLLEYAQRRGLAWVEDPSNAAGAHDRNFLRHSIVPALRTRWPAVSATLAQLALTCADEQRVLDGAAAAELGTALGHDGALACGALRTLGAAQARNALRYWLRTAGFKAPPRTRLNALLRQATTAREDSAPLVAWDGCEVRRYRDALYATPPLGPAPVGMLPFDRHRPLTLPDGSVLTVERRVGDGLDARFLEGDVCVRWRRGGERLVLAGRRHHTSVKKLLQARGVLPWLRDRLPLVYVDGELAAVADLCVAAPFAAAAHAPGCAVKWRNARSLYAASGSAAPPR